MEYTTTLSSKEELEIIINLLIEAYANDPTYKAVFGRWSTRFMFSGLAHYYSIREHMLICRDKGSIEGIILWNNINSKAISLGDLFKNGVLKSALQFILLTPPWVMHRILHWSSVVNKYHYHDKDHYYLFMIATRVHGKGIGRHLMQEFLKDKEYPVYLENSNVAQNEGFYTNNGFENIGSIDIYGVANQKYLYNKDAVASFKA